MHKFYLLVHTPAPYSVKAKLSIVTASLTCETLNHAIFANFEMHISVKPLLLKKVPH